LLTLAVPSLRTKNAGEADARARVLQLNHGAIASRVAL
jgi:hypothetical protein